jgi:Zn-dependent protease
MLFIVNLSLSLFNLIPLPPLDGSKIVLGMLPNRMKSSYLHHSHYIAIVFVILMIAESALSIKSISYILNPIFNAYFTFWGQIYSIRGF